MIYNNIIIGTGLYAGFYAEHLVKKHKLQYLIVKKNNYNNYFQLNANIKKTNMILLLNNENNKNITIKKYLKNLLKNDNKKINLFTPCKVAML